MRAHPTRRPRPIHALCLALVVSVGFTLSPSPGGQERGNPAGEWRYQSADATWKASSDCSMSASLCLTCVIG